MPECAACGGSGLVASGVEYMGHLEMVGCVDCIATGRQMTAEEYQRELDEYAKRSKNA